MFADRVSRVFKTGTNINHQTAVSAYKGHRKDGISTLVVQATLSTDDRRTLCICQLCVSVKYLEKNLV